MDPTQNEPPNAVIWTSPLGLRYLVDRDGTRPWPGAHGLAEDVRRYGEWIRDEAASRMISLGTVTRQDTTLTVPEGVDLASYPVLDVSHEHFDGDPSHSTLSLWVGEMHRTT